MDHFLRCMRYRVTDGEFISRHCKGYTSWISGYRSVNVGRQDEYMYAVHRINPVFIFDRLHIGNIAELYGILSAKKKRFGIKAWLRSCPGINLPFLKECMQAEQRCSDSTMQRPLCEILKFFINHGNVDIACKIIKAKWRVILRTILPQIMSLVCHPTYLPRQMMDVDDKYADRFPIFACLYKQLVGNHCDIDHGNVIRTTDVRYFRFVKRNYNGGIGHMVYSHDILLSGSVGRELALHIARNKGINWLESFINRIEEN